MEADVEAGVKDGRASNWPAAELPHHHAQGHSDIRQPELSPAAFSGSPSYFGVRQEDVELFEERIAADTAREGLAQYFTLPIKEAAARLAIGSNDTKHAVGRWPCRKEGAPAGSPEAQPAPIFGSNNPRSTAHPSEAAITTSNNNDNNDPPSIVSFEQSAGTGDSSPTIARLSCGVALGPGKSLPPLDIRSPGSLDLDETVGPSTVSPSGTASFLSSMSWLEALSNSSQPNSPTQALSVGPPSGSVWPPYVRRRHKRPSLIGFLSGPSSMSNTPSPSMPHGSSQLSGPLPHASSQLSGPLPHASSQLSGPLPHGSTQLSGPLPHGSSQLSEPLPHGSSQPSGPFPDSSQLTGPVTHSSSQISGLLPFQSNLGMPKQSAIKAANKATSSQAASTNASWSAYCYTPSGDSDHPPKDVDVLTSFDEGANRECAGDLQRLSPITVPIITGAPVGVLASLRESESERERQWRQHLFSQSSGGLEADGQKWEEDEQSMQGWGNENRKKQKQDSLSGWTGFSAGHLHSMLEDVQACLSTGLLSAGLHTALQDVIGQALKELELQSGADATGLQTRRDAEPEGVPPVVPDTSETRVDTGCQDLPPSKAQLASRQILHLDTADPKVWQVSRRSWAPPAVALMADPKGLQVTFGPSLPAAVRFRKDPKGLHASPFARQHELQDSNAAACMGTTGPPLSPAASLKLCTRAKGEVTQAGGRCARRAHVRERQDAAPSSATIAPSLPMITSGWPAPFPPERSPIKVEPDSKAGRVPAAPLGRSGSPSSAASLYPPKGHEPSPVAPRSASGVSYHDMNRLYSQTGVVDALLFDTVDMALVSGFSVSTEGDSFNPVFSFGPKCARSTLEIPATPSHLHSPHQAGRMDAAANEGHGATDVMDAAANEGHGATDVMDAAANEGGGATDVMDAVANEGHGATDVMDAAANKGHGATDVMNAAADEQCYGAEVSHGENEQVVNLIQRMAKEDTLRVFEEHVTPADISALHHSLVRHAPSGRKYGTAKHVQEDMAAAKTAQENMAVAKTAQEDMAVAKTVQEDMAAAKTAQEDMAVAKTVQEDMAVAKTALEDMAVAETAQEDMAVAKTAQEDMAVAKTAQEDMAVAKTAQEDMAVAETAQEDMAVANAAQEDAAVAKTTQEDVAVAKTTQEDMAALEDLAALQSTALTMLRQWYEENNVGSVVGLEDSKYKESVILPFLQEHPDVHIFWRHHGDIFLITELSLLCWKHIQPPATSSDEEVGGDVDTGANDDNNGDEGPPSAGPANVAHQATLGNPTSQFHMIPASAPNPPSPSSSMDAPSPTFARMGPSSPDTAVTNPMASATDCPPPTPIHAPIIPPIPSDNVDNYGHPHHNDIARSGSGPPIFNGPQRLEVGQLHMLPPSDSDDDYNNGHPHHNDIARSGSGPPIFSGPRRFEVGQLHLLPPSDSDDDEAEPSQSPLRPTISARTGSPSPDGQLHILAPGPRRLLPGQLSMLPPSDSDDDEIEASQSTPRPTISARRGLPVPDGQLHIVAPGPPAALAAPSSDTSGGSLSGSIFTGVVNRSSSTDGSSPTAGGVDMVAGVAGSGARLSEAVHDGNIVSPMCDDLIGNGSQTGSPTLNAPNSNQLLASALLGGIAEPLSTHSAIYADFPPASDPEVVNAVHPGNGNADSQQVSAGDPSNYPVASAIPVMAVNPMDEGAMSGQAGAALGHELASVTPEAEGIVLGASIRQESNASTVLNGTFSFSVPVAAALISSTSVYAPVPTPHDKRDDGDGCDKRDDGDNCNKRDDGDDSNKQDDGGHCDKRDDGDDCDKRHDGDDCNRQDDGDDCNRQDDGDYCGKRDDGDDCNKREDGVDGDDGDMGRQAGHQAGTRGSGWDATPNSGKGKRRADAARPEHQQGHVDRKRPRLEEVPPMHQCMLGHNSWYTTSSSHGSGSSGSGQHPNGGNRTFGPPGGNQPGHGGRGNNGNDAYNRVSVSQRPAYTPRPCPACGDAYGFRRESHSDPKYPPTTHKSSTSQPIFDSLKSSPFSVTHQQTHMGDQLNIEGAGVKASVILRLCEHDSGKHFSVIHAAAEISEQTSLCYYLGLSRSGRFPMGIEDMVVDVTLHEVDPCGWKRMSASLKYRPSRSRPLEMAVETRAAGGPVYVQHCKAQVSGYAQITFNPTNMFLPAPTIGVEVANQVSQPMLVGKHGQELPIVEWDFHSTDLATHQLALRRHVVNSVVLNATHSKVQYTDSNPQRQLQLHTGPPNSSRNLMTMGLSFKFMILEQDKQYKGPVYRYDVSSKEWKDAVKVDMRWRP